MPSENTLEQLLSNICQLEDSEALPFVPDRSGGNALLEGLPVAVMARDMEDGRILWLNRACADLLGVDAAGASGKTTTGIGVDIILNRGDPHLIIPGDPVRATLIDHDGAKISCLVFRRRMELCYRKVELDLVVEAQKLVDDDGTGGVRKLLLDRALAGSGGGYIIAELLQISAEDGDEGGAEDLLVLEWGGNIPESLAEDLSRGVSINSSVPALSDAGLVQAATRAESQREPQVIDIPDVGRAEVSLEPPATAVVFFRSGHRASSDENIIIAGTGTGAEAPEDDAEAEEEPAVETAEQQDVHSNLHRGSEKQAVMYLGFDEETLESGEKMLTLLGFNPVPVHGSEADAPQLEALATAVQTIVVDVTSRYSELAFELLSELDFAGSILLIADEKIVYELKGRGLVPGGWVSRPCGINDLAMALSDL